jgi:hypothetical protein
MKNIFWLIAIVLAFFAGYFTHSVTEIPEEAIQVATPVAVPAETSSTNTPVSSEQLSAAAKAVFAEKQKQPASSSQAQTTSEPNTGIASASHTANSSVAADANNTATNKYPNEISDEDIDKVIPAPFNQKLKNKHGELREKYKDFAATNQQLEWDKNMQNKLSDAILGNPYSKFIILDSLQCKVNLCEIRLYETKEGAWSLIMAEMRLQEWWDFGGTSASGFGTDTPSKMGWYALFPRR